MIKQFKLLSGWFKLSSALIALILPAIILVPLPGVIIDIFVLFSFIMSAMILSIMLENDNPLKVTFLPTVVLLLTTFRLLLSIATTRNILTNDNVGTVIEVVGDFVMEAGLLSGIIVFVIITIVQFLVVTKGGERVAEVGARFSLDALPGRQMTIDGDLKNNMITGEEAQVLRAELSTENRLFGALEGAMKFIKGDAIAGILISFVNLFGGIYVGINTFELSLADSLTRFSMLTIGDGLVSQIPSLLLSVACGIYLTRIKGVNEKSSSFTSQLVGQIGIFWKNLVFIGLFMLLLGAFSPDIIYICLSMAGACFMISFVLWRATKDASKSIVKMMEGNGSGLFESLTFTLKTGKHQSLIQNGITEVENQLWLQNLGCPHVIINAELSNDIEVSVLGIPLYSFKQDNSTNLEIEEIMNDGLFYLNADINNNLSEIIQYFLRQRLVNKYNIQITNNILEDLASKSDVMKKEVDSAIGINRVHDIIKQVIGSPEFNLDSVSFFEALIYWSRIDNDPKNWFIRIRNQACYEITSKLMNAEGKISVMLLSNELSEMMESFIQGEEDNIDKLVSIKKTVREEICRLTKKYMEKTILIVSDMEFNYVKTFMQQISSSIIVCSYSDISDSNLIINSDVIQI